VFALMFIPESAAFFKAFGPGSIWNWFSSTRITMPPEESRFLPITKEPWPVPKNVIEA